MEEKGFIRAFLCIAIEEKSLADLFKTQIIDTCVHSSTYKYVQSIYKTKGIDKFNCHYILDVIALPHKVFDMILKLHKKSDKFGIKISSDTYIMVEHLTQGMFTGPIEGLIKKDERTEKDEDIDNLIERGESESVEFKASFKWDYKLERANKDREFDVVRTIAAFANTNGGYLVIGVEDQTKEILGVETDFSTLGKKDQDGFELHLMNVLERYLGINALYLLSPHFEIKNEKTICKIKINPSPSNMPVFLLRDDREEFYVRRGNATKQLSKVTEIKDYLRRRFPAYLK